MSASTTPVRVCGILCRSRKFITKYFGTIALVGLLLAFSASSAWPRLKGRFATRGTTAMEPIAWRTDFDAARKEAKRTGKLLLVDFSASWCGPCQEMKRNVWSDDSVARTVAQQYIPLTLDIDAPESAQPAQHFGVTSIPAIYVVDSNGNIVRSSIGYVGTDDMLGFLNPKSNAATFDGAASPAACKSCWDLLRRSN